MTRKKPRKIARATAPNDGAGRRRWGPAPIREWAFSPPPPRCPRRWSSPPPSSPAHACGASITWLSSRPPRGGSPSLLLALAFVPAVARPAYRGLLWGAERFAGANRRARLGAMIVIAATAVLGFWRAALLDAAPRRRSAPRRSFEAAEGGHEQVIMRSPRRSCSEEFIAPGTTLLYYGAVEGRDRPFQEDRRLLDARVQLHTGRPVHVPAAGACNRPVRAASYGLAAVARAGFVLAGTLLRLHRELHDAPFLLCSSTSCGVSSPPRPGSTVASRYPAGDGVLRARAEHPVRAVVRVPGGVETRGPAARDASAPAGRRCSGAWP